VKSALLLRLLRARRAYLRQPRAQPGAALGNVNKKYVMSPNGAWFDVPCCLIRFVDSPRLEWRPFGAKDIFIGLKTQGCALGYRRSPLRGCMAHSLAGGISWSGTATSNQVGNGTRSVPTTSQFRLIVSSKFSTKLAIIVQAAVSMSGAIRLGFDSPTSIAFAAAVGSAS
jgi:hypothetical protein